MHIEQYTINYRRNGRMERVILELEIDCMNIEETEQFIEYIKKFTNA